MDCARVELIGPLRLDELRREAARARTIAAVDGTGEIGLGVAAAVGRLLVRAGRRLEAIGAARPLALAVDACGGRAD